MDIHWFGSAVSLKRPVLATTRWRLVTFQDIRAKLIPRLADLSSRCFLFSFLVISAPFLEASPESRIEYQVRIAQPAQRYIFVRAVAGGFPKGPVTFRLQVPEAESVGLARRISHLRVETPDGDEIPLSKTSESSYTFSNDEADDVVISYRLKAQTLAVWQEATCCDGFRCLLHLRDVLLVFPYVSAHTSISFDLPLGWKSIAPAKRDEALEYLISPGGVSMFYLGKAVEVRTNINSLRMVMAVEKGWPLESDDTLREVKRQVNYLGKSTREWQAQPAFAIFLEGRSTGRKNRVAAFHNGDVLAMQSLSASSDRKEDLDLIRRCLADELVRCYMPFLDGAEASDASGGLREYLVWKTLLKTGGILRGDFLRQMALGFRDATVSGPDDFKVLHVPPKLAHGGLLAAPAERVAACFLADLALSFSNKEGKSLYEVLQDLFGVTRDPRKAEGDFLRRAHPEKEWPRVQQFWDKTASSAVIAELLKPYGLTLTKTDFSRLDLDLSESFQVRQASRSDPQGRLALLPGDRVVAVDDYQLATPADLVKVRSLINNEKEVTITVERNGSFCRITQGLDKEVRLNLEPNKLSDSDKLEKLAQFLSKEVED